MLFFVIMGTLFVSFVQCEEIHELMTDKEIADVFGTSRESVPKYEVVPVAHSFDKQLTITKLKTRFFGQYFVLDLSPAKKENSKFTKIWKGKTNNSSPTGVSFTYLGESHSVHIQEKFHHDVKRSASFIINEDKSGFPLFNGVIGGNFAIRSLPERLQSHSNELRSDFNLTDIAEEDLNMTHGHVMYQISQSEDKIGNLTKDSISGKTKMEVETLYPEIMVVMDEILFRNFKYDVLKAVEYLIMFWNGVDTRFSSLLNPDFRLSLAQIIVMEDTLPFIKNSSAEGNIMKTNEAIEAMREYFFLEDEVGQFRVNKDYDLALVMTGYDMSFQTSNGWDRNVHGVAHNGGACRKVKNMVTATGIFEDNGGFRGMITGFHELGHLLGADHDGVINKPSEKCLVKQGYVMGGQIGRNMFVFSKCSVNAIQEHVQSGRSPCMKNPPSVKTSLIKKSDDKYIIPVRLPGQYFSLEEQCNGNSPCYKDERVCTNLCCKNDANVQFWKIPLYGKAPAADGSPCGNRRICFSGYCIGLPNLSK